jgi:hypothetical protein
MKRKVLVVISAMIIVGAIYNLGYHRGAGHARRTAPSAGQASRNALLNQGMIIVPETGPASTLASFKGVLTDPEFRRVLQALENRDGSDLPQESTVFTLGNVRVNAPGPVIK